MTDLNRVNNYESPLRDTQFTTLAKAVNSLVKKPREVNDSVYVPQHLQIPELDNITRKVSVVWAEMIKHFAEDFAPVILNVDSQLPPSSELLDAFHLKLFEAKRLFVQKMNNLIKSDSEVQECISRIMSISGIDLGSFVDTLFSIFAKNLENSTETIWEMAELFIRKKFEEGKIPSQEEIDQWLYSKNLKKIILLIAKGSSLYARELLGDISVEFYWASQDDPKKVTKHCITRTDIFEFRNTGGEIELNFIDITTAEAIYDRIFIMAQEKPVMTTGCPALFSKMHDGSVIEYYYNTIIEFLRNKIIPADIEDFKARGDAKARVISKVEGINELVNSIA